MDFSELLQNEIDSVQAAFETQRKKGYEQAAIDYPEFLNRLKTDMLGVVKNRASQLGYFSVEMSLGKSPSMWPTAEAHVFELARRVELFRYIKAELATWKIKGLDVCHGENSFSVTWCAPKGHPRNL